MPRWAIGVVSLVAAWFIVPHLLHVFTEVINWDEFALLERADRTLRFGKVVGDGRPGLITILLVPFVRDCIDSARSVVNARLLWQIITFAYLVGVYFVVRSWFRHARRPDEGHAQGLIAVALLAFIPAFVTWSVQVRTDQAALAAAIWGGVFLLSTSYRSAAVAGALFAIALLCTQKALYVLGLCGVLFATATGARAWPWSSVGRRELMLAMGRAAVVVASLVVVIAIYRYFVPEVSGVASDGALALAADTMALSRKTQGYRIYTVHAHRLVVHWALLSVLFVWTLRSLWRREASEYALLACCWLTLVLGLIVIWIHGSSFPYFIMTAGLFPALALAMASGRPLTRLGRSTWPVIACLIVFSALQSAPENIEMFDDTQQGQRDTLKLVYSSGLRERRGYQVEGALFCSRDPAPMRTMFSPGIYTRFRKSPDAEKNSADFIAEFRNRPIAYIVESHRLMQFPKSITSFLQSHYVWYAHALLIAGFNFESTGETAELDVIVPGNYRWVPTSGHRDASIQIDGKMLQPLGIVELSVGTHPIQAADRETRGTLMLADLPIPKETGNPAFYHIRQRAQLGGYR